MTRLTLSSGNSAKRARVSPRYAAPSSLVYAGLSTITLIVCRVIFGNRLENCRVYPTARQIFSQNVRSERVAKGLSQEDLAELAGLHRNYVGGVERGERNISVDNMEKIAMALGTTIPKLLKEPSSLVKSSKGA